jgi:hypothetical protein
MTFLLPRHPVFKVVPSNTMVSDDKISYTTGNTYE